MFLSSHLNFSTHIDFVGRKISSGIFVLRRLSKFSNVDLLMTAYYGLIHPFMVYAVCIWGAESTRSNYIFRLQRRAIRVIFKLPRSSNCELSFSNNRILTFPCIYMLETLIIIKRNFQNFQKFLPNHLHNTRNRNSLILNIPPHSKAFFQKHTVYSGITLYNHLPIRLKLEADTNKFKHSLKKIISNKMVL